MTLSTAVQSSASMPGSMSDYAEVPHTTLLQNIQTVSLSLSFFMPLMIDVGSYSILFPTFL